MEDTAQKETAQASLDILCILGFIDGQLVESEIEVILTFLEKYYGRVDPIDDEINSIKDMSLQEMLSKLEKSANIIKTNLPKEDRYKVLKFANELIFADGILHENETKCFTALKKMWDIDFSE